MRCGTEALAVILGSVLTDSDGDWPILQPVLGLVEHDASVLCSLQSDIDDVEL